MEEAEQENPALGAQRGSLNTLAIVNMYMSERLQVERGTRNEQKAIRCSLKFKDWSEQMNFNK